MAATGYPVRRLTAGEMLGIGLAGVAALGLLPIAGLTESGAFSFHAIVGILAALGTILFIGNRAFDGRSLPVPQEIDGKPNYKIGRAHV